MLLWVLVLQLLHHFSVRFELGVDILDAQLVILRYSDELAFCYRQQRLLTLEDLAHEVAVDGSERRHIKLDYKKKVTPLGSDLRCSLM